MGKDIPYIDGCFSESLYNGWLLGLTSRGVSRTPFLMLPPKPHFRNPPIVEQAITVSFEPLAKLSISHFGQFGDEVAGDFPDQRHDHRLETAEEHDELQPGFNVAMRLVPPGLPRMMYCGSSELIQLQDDRFGYNWAKLDSESDYPRWDNTLPRFMALYDQFYQFIEKKDIGPIVLRQCEITNLNFVPVASFGDSFSDIRNVFNVDPLDMGVPFLIPETYVRVRQHRILDADGVLCGRLHTSIHPMFAQDNGIPGFRFELTARSMPTLDTVEKITKFFDLAHNSINAAFVAICTPEMKQKWGEEL